MPTLLTLRPETHLFYYYFVLPHLETPKLFPNGSLEVANLGNGKNIAALTIIYLKIPLFEM